MIISARVLLIYAPQLQLLLPQQLINLGGPSTVVGRNNVFLQCYFCTWRMHDAHLYTNILIYVCVTVICGNKMNMLIFILGLSLLCYMHSVNTLVTIQSICCSTSVTNMPSCSRSTRRSFIRCRNTSTIE